ncbi:hypothetical protein GCM10009541_49590 [Micromonospora gifhornensis]|uniref:Helicase ATP-binding domain-containing protein n=1 Tax=Micromonospora gifhornensis TaxID=84594 RepID=A0ABQ4IKZ7_9ACTN|nr:hypothetical protein [Micromonospora gifhornensis]GIJ18501.1 hypothetical protein Vgi01_51850 [Micromonospora gifhornensis]
MNEAPIRETAVLAALALAAHYFPQKVEGDPRAAAPFAEAAFLVSGKYQAWNRWKGLPHSEKQRISMVCSIAPGELSEHRAFSIAARAILAPMSTGQADETSTMAAFELVGKNPFTADAALPRVGGDLLEYVDRQIARFRRPSARPKPLDFAGPGTWSTGEIFVKEVGQVHGRLTIPAYPQFTEPLGHDRLPHVSTVPYLPNVPIPTRELLHLAEKIDLRYPPDKRYLHRTLSQLFAVLQTTDTVSAREALTLAAGGLEIFHAPTGTGKSVLVRVMAAWFAVNDRRVAIILPDIKACLAATWNVRGDLAHLHRSGITTREPTCAHLMSSSGMHDRALKLASLIDEEPDAPGEWGERGERDLDPLAYGCAQKTFLEATGDYPPGREPCLSLHRQGVGSAACPWIPTCGKFAPVYEACAANVVIMNHYVFMQGTLRIGVNLDSRPVRSMTAAEFALRTCHAVLLDEVDQFQSRAIDKCASEVVLHSRRHWSAAPQEMDTDAKRLRIDDEHSLLPAISHVRLMAEFLLLNICKNALSLHATEDDRAQARIPDQTSSRWHLARGRDRTLIRLLWPDADLADADIPAEMFQRLNALMPARYQRDDPLGAQVSLLEPDWDDVRRALSVLVAPRGEHLLDMVKLELHELLKDCVEDPHRRAQTINLLVTRATMIELDEALSELQDRARDFRSSGLRSAQKILDDLQTTAITSVLPLGMLGRSITGYRVTGLDDKEKNAALVAQTIAGDPHTFTAELGGIVSLTLAGMERPVMGLSATAYFPQAVREHLHAPVRWWMTDAQAKSIRARKHRIDYGEGHPLFGEPIKISGLHPSRKKDALIELGSNLYDQYIHRELERTAAKDPDRAHVLVVANSYEQCALLARGIAQAGRYNGGLCVAVRAQDRHSIDPDLPRDNIAVRLTSEEFEDFPKHGKILVVPLSLIARGLNIVVGTRSAVRSVYLCVRPLALLSEPAEMYGSINAAGLRALPADGSPVPSQALARARDSAWERLALLLRTAAQFTSIHKSLQEEIVAGMIVDLIQLAGRARRGGTEAVLHMVDYAFHEDTWSADLETVLRRVHSQWTPQVRTQMNNLYGEALNAFLSYAGIETHEPGQPGD